jgi:hypothetical protein
MCSLRFLAAVVILMFHNFLISHLTHPILNLVHLAGLPQIDWCHPILPVCDPLKISLITKTYPTTASKVNCKK